MKTINHYANKMREKFGERVQKITVLGGFTCPNRDGSLATGGCTFCNNETFAAPNRIAHLSITDQINHGIKTASRRYKAKKFIIYFQSYSNTYAPIEKLRSLYLEALNHPQVVGLAIGTRVDCIDDEKLNFLQELARDYSITLEYGIESIFDQTLERINRGHNFHAVQTTIEKTSGREIDICGHLILGFPWETIEDAKKSALAISKLPLDSLKIHQLHVVKETAMEREYLSGKLVPATYEQYRELIITFLENLSPEIAIQRLYGEAPKQMLVSPQWNSSTAQFSQEIEALLHKRNSFQGKYYNSTF